MGGPSGVSLALGRDSGRGRLPSLAVVLSAGELAVMVAARATGGGASAARLAASSAAVTKRRKVLIVARFGCLCMVISLLSIAMINLGRQDTNADSVLSLIKDAVGIFVHFLTLLPFPTT